MPRGVPRNKPGRLFAGDEDGAHAAQPQLFHRAVFLREDGFWVRTALFRNVQQAVAAQQIEDHVTFRRAELAGFLHSDAARFFAFQQPLDFSCSE